MAIVVPRVVRHISRDMPVGDHKCEATKAVASALGDNISGVSYFQGRPCFLGVLSIVDMIARDGQDMLFASNTGYRILLRYSSMILATPV
ncbi:hypothetical protein FOXG_21829 [Fusarium oxysporum f. sp. lycopersici 4287]|uniref:Uncharacterized protein n=1 Tax=Fusarium oxysporum f. sp. lycopersici (strain 4287 / CBS 123668 / FGSC 9935 / NRRL 34936) TaxID=426428 RepID=A0A0J9W1Y3_FUSO4|nr:hypothetical protein FOXG_21829 [Fusarium oxysporum f. sp. lycopersici 4287]KNB16906.1 hypothetical protein FOXG_21829 [Fusarium oxysporum f. sp. lycopersici 4287]